MAAPLGIRVLGSFSRISRKTNPSWFSPGRTSPHGTSFWKDGTARRSNNARGMTTQTKSFGGQKSFFSRGWTQTLFVSAGVGTAVIVGLSLAKPAYLDSPSRGRRPSGGVQEKKLITKEELDRHRSPESMWVVIGDEVYDVTGYFEAHPGGPDLIAENAGKDITTIFRRLHPPHTLTLNLPPAKYLVGILDPTSEPPEQASMAGFDEVAIERKRQEILPPVNSIKNLHEFETLAKEVFGSDARAWKFIHSWADDGYTYRATQESFSFLRFLPRVFSYSGIGAPNTSATFLATPPSSSSGDTTLPVSLPIYISPTGQVRSSHPEGEFNFIETAKATGIPYCISSASSFGLDEILEKGRGKEQTKKAELWFQLYIRSRRHESEKAIKDAIKAGVKAILLTVDVQVLGNREADQTYNNSSGTNQAVGGGAAAKVFESDLTWEDLAWLKKFAGDIPVLIKGISSPEDVLLAHQAGASGVVLSNHGARQLDFSPPPLATLVRMRKDARYKWLLDEEDERNKKRTAGGFEVYIDGGVRRGTDVLKALALGAKGVGVGRAFLYGQACYGAEGSIRVANILRNEIETGMKLLGAKTIKDLKPEMVELMDGLVGEQLE